MGVTPAAPRLPRRTTDDGAQFRLRRTTSRRRLRPPSPWRRSATNAAPTVPPVSCRRPRRPLLSSARSWRERRDRAAAPEPRARSATRSGAGPVQRAATASERRGARSPPTGRRVPFGRRTRAAGRGGPASDAESSLGRPRRLAAVAGPSSVARRRDRSVGLGGTAGMMAVSHARRTSIAHPSRVDGVDAPRADGYRRLPYRRRRPNAATVRAAPRAARSLAHLPCSPAVLRVDARRTPTGFEVTARASPGQRSARSRSGTDSRPAQAHGRPGPAAGPRHALLGVAPGSRRHADRRTTRCRPIALVDSPCVRAALGRVAPALAADLRLPPAAGSDARRRVNSTRPAIRRYLSADRPSRPSTFPSHASWAVPAHAPPLAIQSRAVGDPAEEPVPL